eukprot:scaffold26973_cov89-Skeletonema_dohrnii-CCMP3373.AAC.1
MPWSYSSRVDSLPAGLLEQAKDAYLILLTNARDDDVMVIVNVLAGRGVNSFRSSQLPPNKSRSQVNPKRASDIQRNRRENILKDIIKPTIMTKAE